MLEIIYALIAFPVGILAAWVVIQFIEGFKRGWRGEPSGLAAKQPPELEDSPVWSARTRVEPTLDEALALVLAHGELAARCGSCKSIQTTIDGVKWERWGSVTYVAVVETCMNCDFQQSYRVDQLRWACLGAFRAWDEFRQATDTLEITIQSEREEAAAAAAEAKPVPGPEELDKMLEAEDLRELDEAPKIPRKLQRCRKCSRWLEAYDGTLSCECDDPDIYEG